MLQPRKTVPSYFILFMAISFLGWAAETVFFSLCYGGFHDRGFMTMPFCTIYGFSFLLLYWLIGTPTGEHTGLLPRAVHSCRLFPPLYVLLSALIPTAVELLTGIFFHRLFGIRLWSYSAYRFHLNGYICLEYSLLWGLLLPLCMHYVFLPLKAGIFSLSDVSLRHLARLLAMLTLADWTANFSRQTLLLP